MHSSVYGTLYCHTVDLGRQRRSGTLCWGLSCDNGDIGLQRFDRDWIQLVATLPAVMSVAQFRCLSLGCLEICSRNRARGKCGSCNRPAERSLKTTPTLTEEIFPWKALMRLRL